MGQNSRDIEAWMSRGSGLENDHVSSSLETEETWRRMAGCCHGEKSSKLMKSRRKKKKKQVLLEGEDDLKRTKSLTDEDLDELKGCLDLGFGFRYDEIPELCNTLPALELCYSMSQRFLDEQHSLGEAAQQSSAVANWKISSPGDHPEDVKARLKYWAQAVACTVKLCS